MTWIFKLFALILTVNLAVVIVNDLKRHRIPPVYDIDERHLDEIERDTGLDLRSTIFVGELIIWSKQ